MIKENKENVRGGIFLKLYLPLTTIEKEKVFEESMKKIIRKGKDKYNMKEYAACLEKSEQGLFHVHIYINQFMPLKEINKQGCDLIGVEDLTKGHLYMTIVESEEHKTNILSYIGKAPLRTGICQEYKDKYGGKTGNMNKVEEIVTEERIIASGFNDDEKSVTQKVAENGNTSLKKALKDRGLKQINFKCASHKGEDIKIYKKQKDFEKEYLIIKSIEDFKKKGGRSYKDNLKVLKSFVSYIEPYVIYDSISKNMKQKTKEVMLLNMVYIAFQLENIKESIYIYYKIGEKLFKYYDLNKQLVNHLIEINKHNIKNKNKISKAEGKIMYSNFYISDEYKSYKESIIKIGVRHFKIFKDVFYKVNILNRLELKKEIVVKIKNIFNINNLKKFKYKIPLVEKPIEGGPNKEDYGGGHSIELRKSLVKENINQGHNLELNYKRIYSIINRLQSIEYSINKEGLNFILNNKDKIYSLLLNDLDKESVAYKTKKEQFDITLNIALYLSNFEKFYFTYEFDYRGRIYIVQEYLNYQGNLLARSLIQFANAKKKYSFFLKIACVSLYKSILNENYNTVYNYYNSNILNGDFKNGYDYAKEAKEPILGLQLFFELNFNKKETTNQIIGFDATCSGSQLVSLFVDDDSFLKELNIIRDNQINDYYMAIYNKFNGFKNINYKDARKLIKKIVMTINYGLTKIGCNRYFYQKLVELKYCSSKEEYKLLGKDEVMRFYDFLNNLSLVKNLEELQMIGKQLSSQNIVYQFVIGDKGFIVKNKNSEDFIFKMTTLCYKKYYKNLSLFNKSRKKKEKGFKYLGHHKKIFKYDQYRKIKANIIHMLDGTGNILTCEKFLNDIATIHDCHGIHSCDIIEGFDIVKKVLIRMFERNTYYYLLEDMLLHYYNLTNDVVFYKEMKSLILKYEPFFSKNILKGLKVRISKYLFVPK